jgi:predicted RNase H-like nuclease (RuvC/YqgF family)
MAQITQLESKLAEVLGLAQAAQQATKKVARLAKGEKELVALLDRMNAEAKETEKRCKALAEKRDGKKTAINRKARETKTEAGEMMAAYLGGDDVDALDGFEFLTMAEAGELGHWEIVKTMATKAKDRPLVRLAEWATPIQQGHVEAVRASSLQLAEDEDPNEPEG